MARMPKQLTRPHPTANTWAVDRLEPRQLLATQPLGVPGPWAGGLPSATASDGHHAYYYAFAQRGGLNLADIYRTDGTPAGTKLLGSVTVGSRDGESPTDFTLIDGQLFFLAPDDDSHGRELYAVSPATDQIVKLSDFSVSSRTNMLGDLVALNGKAYVAGWSAATGHELYESDGTAAGTKLSFEAVPGPADGVVNLGAAGDTLYCSAQTGANQWSVYELDAGAANPQFVITVNNVPSSYYLDGPAGFAAVAGGRAVFTVMQAVGNNRENVLWVTDGTAAGTAPIKSYAVNERGGWKLASAGNFAAFASRESAGDGRGAIFVTDGTAAGTVELYGNYQLPDSSFYQFVPAGGAIYWGNSSGSSVHNGLHRINADATVTKLNDGAAHVAAVGDRVYFSGGYFNIGGAVGVSDGTVAGTDLLADPTDAPYVSPVHFVATANGIVFGVDGQLYRIAADAPPLPSISGFLFRDRNRNGVRDAGEEREPNATLSPNLPVNADGSYTLQWALPGSVTVSAAPQFTTVVPTTATSRTYTVAEEDVITGADFGFERISVVTGVVRIDSDLDDFVSAFEPPAAGKKVFADLDRDGVVDAGEPTAVSDASGAYRLDLRTTGSVLVRVANEPGWYVSAPPGGPGYEVATTEDGAQLTNYNFGVTQTPPRNYLGYTMFEDLDRDGARDPGEKDRSGGFVWVDLDDNGTFEANEPSSSSVSSTIRLPGPGTYRLRFRGPTGWANTVPAPLVTLAPGERVYGLALGVAVPPPSGATLAGIAFNDTDRDGVRDSGEAANVGLKVYLDTDGDFAADPDEPNLVTDSLGRFAFVDLQPGTYTVRQTQIGIFHQQTTPAPGEGIVATLGAGEQRLDLLFGQRVFPSADLGSITATYFHDANANGVKEAGEGAFTASGATAYFDVNNNGAFDGFTTERSIAAAAGFTFGNIAAGRYRLRLSPQDGMAFVPSTYDPAEGLVVSQGHNQDTVLEIGLYRPTVTVTSATFEPTRTPQRVRLTFSGVWDTAAVLAGASITGPGGAKVQPSSTTWNNGGAVLDLNFGTPLPDGDYELRVAGAALAGSPGLPAPNDYLFHFRAGPPAWLAAGSAATWNPAAKTLTVTGPATLVADPGVDAPIVTASGSSAVLTISTPAGGQVNLGGLQLSDNAAVNVSAAGAARTLVVANGANLTLGATAKLDLGDNALVIRNANASAASAAHASVNNLVRSAFHEFAWDGAGIASSAVRTNVANGVPAALGTLLNHDGSGNPLFYGDGTAATGDLPQFQGVSVDANSVLVRFTKLGDGDLNGTVDSVDFALFQAGYTGAAPYVGFAFGDYDYNGAIDSVDFGLFQAGYEYSQANPSAADEDEERLAVVGSSLTN